VLYVFEDSITSEIILGCIDSFVGQSTKPTVIAMDRASIHTSQMMREKLPEWKSQQVEIFQLPTYSPQLNLLEILWRLVVHQSVV